MNIAFDVMLVLNALCVRTRDVLSLVRCKCKTETLRSGLIASIATGLLQGDRQLNNEGDAGLWDEFVMELRLKATPRVKGHATKVHIDREITTTLERGRNGGADALASALFSGPAPRRRVGAVKVHASPV